MHAMPLICQILSRLEQRNQKHCLRLYGTLARGAVWSCMNRVNWAMDDLRRILLWGVKRGLIEKNEARRLWTLVGMIAEASRTAGHEPDGIAARAQGPPPNGESGRQGAGAARHDVRTRLNAAGGMSHPWQEWVTERIKPLS